jgi:myo-inositol 2-dehydrogenase/D-chiro-inositol 1-dehydrogenase
VSVLGIGVIGVGRIGAMHARLLAAQVPGAHVAALNDAVPEPARLLGEELGVPVADTADELMARSDVDAVAICSSTETHAALIAAAAEAGRAIFCEKPVSHDLVEVDRALDAVRAAGVPFQIGFNRRFDPAHQSVRDAVAGGRIGEPHLLRITSRDPYPPPASYVRASGGIVLDMTIHDFDMARYVTGSEVVEVYARGAVRIDESFAEAGDVDTALVVLVHENGCITSIDNSRQTSYGYDQRVEAFGLGGMAASENPLRHTGFVRSAEGTIAPDLPDFFLERYIPSYIREWEAFVSAVGSGSETAAGVEDARAPLVIGLAAGRSLQEGRPVRVEEVVAA